MRNKKGSDIQVGITCDVFGLGFFQKLAEIIFGNYPMRCLRRA